LLPGQLDDCVADNSPARSVDIFVDELGPVQMGFERTMPAQTERPAHHPSVLLKIYIYGYLNRLQSSRRLEREAQRNVELMWLTGLLTFDARLQDHRRLPQRQRQCHLQRLPAARRTLSAACSLLETLIVIDDQLERDNSAGKSTLYLERDHRSALSKQSR